MKSRAIELEVTELSSIVEQKRSNMEHLFPRCLNSFYVRRYTIFRRSFLFLLLFPLLLFVSFSETDDSIKWGAREILCARAKGEEMRARNCE